MSVEVTMPKLSDTMEEGKILRWLKQVGEPVRIGEALAEVETDKANMELEAYDEGVLAEVRVAENESAPVGAVIAVLREAGEQPKATEKAPPAPERRTEARPATAIRETQRPATVRRPPQPERAGDQDAVRASPLARRIAQERGVDLRGVKGSGPGGRIVEKDVERAEPAPPARGPAVGKPSAEPSPKAPAAKPAASSPAVPPGRHELSRIRRTVAKRMAEAKREVPHFYASAEIAMGEAVRLKEALGALGADYAGVTYTHLVLKAVGLALKRVPEVNASYDGDAVLLHAEVNVGMATATDEGLLVPVVRRCDREPLSAIVRQARALAERTRSRRLGGDDLVGGTFTVSNLGMFPVSEFAAIINAPQAAILAVSMIREVPVVRDGRIEPGRLMTVTLSSDHRIVDGALAGRFLGELKAILENPITLIA